MLDASTERLCCLDHVVGARLEAEGHELIRMVMEHVLVYLRTHNPSISLTPVDVGPVAGAEDAAHASVRDIVELVEARFQHDSSDA